MIKAELIDHMGSDITVVNSARVSFNKTSDFNPTGQLTEQDTRLIRYLARHNHFTPFTHPQITLRETVPIFVARQRFKHVVGFSYNEVSRRYVDDTPEFYVPEVWRSRPTGSVKQGSAGPVPGQKTIQDSYSRFRQLALHEYELLIEMGVAPEQARMVLPQSMLTAIT
jgi:thymidylate synthase (FAD)